MAIFAAMLRTSSNRLGAPTKITIEISDSLFAEAKMLAAAEDTRFRQLVETGLRLAITQRKRQVAPFTFRLRDASFGGKGLVEELRGAPGEDVRDMAYKGRGS